MNKKVLSLIIAISLPLTFLVGCKQSKNDAFVMTEDTVAYNGSLGYSAKTYKDEFYSTENYSNEYLQNEFETMIKEVTAKEDKDELVNLLKSYSMGKDDDLKFLKTYFEKHNTKNGNSQDITLDSNVIHEISSRLYKATLNATKKYYDINDFYIYYKNQLSTNSNVKDDEDFENKVKITAIKEYTIANIYKNAYNDSFISKVITSIDNYSNNNESIHEETIDEEAQTDIKPENTKPVIDNSNSDSNNNNTNDNISTDDSNDDYPEYIELNDTVKSQIYDAGVNGAIEFISQSQNIQLSPSAYCRELYDALENDNPLGENKEEGYKFFLQGFKTTLETNNVSFE